jgi:hypothetical protein
MHAQLTIGNRQSEMKSPALNNAGLQIRLKFFGSPLSCPSCLAGYFTWPQVALTHHVFHRCLYAPKTTAVKFEPTSNYSWTQWPKSA